jgi:protein tyrosine phosphatase (PTP) superfamily phosphohydrolase (DUF442 family)
MRADHSPRQPSRVHFVIDVLRKLWEVSNSKNGQFTRHGGCAVPAAGGHGIREAAVMGKLNWLRMRQGRNFLVVALALLVVLGIFVAHLFAGHNFRVVSPGRVYRSAQLNAQDLTRTIQEHGIKSIFNLRGSADGPKGAWYATETNISQTMGVQHYDFALLAGTELKNAEMEEILAAMEQAPKPILIHCKSGSDRTGLVGALYLYTIEGKSAAVANRELTILCGHVPYLFWRDTIAMDRSFWRYVGNHPQPARNGAGLITPEIAPVTTARVE